MMQKAFCLIAVLFFAVWSSLSSAAEWKPLFNGKDLSEWKTVGNTIENWKAENDTFRCAEGGGWLATNAEYANFELELEFKVDKGANSGVFLRAPLQGDASTTGLEIQILDNDAPQYASLKPYQYCGGLYHCEGPSTKAFTKAGEWQKYHITVNNRNVKVVLNDTPIIDANLDKYMDHVKEHPGLANTTGHVGLQAHGGRVDFRNVRIKELP